jgi:hypothetical protein
LHLIEKFERLGWLTKREMCDCLVVKQAEALDHAWIETKLHFVSEAFKDLINDKIEAVTSNENTGLVDMTQIYLAFDQDNEVPDLGRTELATLVRLPLTALNE